MPDMYPYPWNPWIHAGIGLKCSFCEASYLAVNPVTAHTLNCPWRIKFVEVYGKEELPGPPSMWRTASTELLKG